MSTPGSQSPRRGTSTRGRGRGVPSEWRARRASPPPGRGPKRNITDGLKAEPIHAFEKIDDADGEDVGIKDVQQHGSYSWIDTQEPTIAVPGSPRIWLDKPLPFRVPRDTGRTFVDQNRFRLHGYPMLPLFAAVDTLETDPDHPKLQWDTVDFVTERNNLLKLLTFAEPSLDSLRDSDFRIDLELISPWTILMQRWETEASRSVGALGYGESFERATTKPGPGCDGSILTSHNRIISYDLAGLKMLVRFEVDACYPSQTASESPDLDELADALASTNIGDPPASAPPTTKIGPINVIRAGQAVAQKDLIKVKTKSSVTPFPWIAAYPQLLLGQTPTLKVGIQTRGTFETILSRELDSPEFDEEKKMVQPALNKLRTLLGHIHDAALVRGRGAMLSIVCQDGVLKLKERVDGRSLLPPKVIRRFDPDNDYETANVQRDLNIRIEQP